MTKLTGLFVAILLSTPQLLSGQSLRSIEFVRFEAEIMDADSNVPIPARIYIKDENGTFHFVRSASTIGSACPYTEEWVKMTDSIEQHTTVSAHPFFANLPHGKYEIEIERGKEYIPLRETITIDAEVSSRKSRHPFRLKRWSDVSKKGWYTAGTASGVHPVPLGHSRVYVHTGNPFSADRWLAGLKQGRSFVTTGPMLLATIQQQPPGHEFKCESKQVKTFTWNCEVESLTPITKVEWLINGNVHTSLEPVLTQTELGTYRFEGKGDFEIDQSGWAIVRTWSEQSDGRKRFAHSAPWYFQIAEEPVRPPQEQLDYLRGQIETALQQQQGVLSPEAIAEFIEARNFYSNLRAK